MGIVHEVVDLFPFDDSPRVLRRSEELLLGEARPGPVKLWTDPVPLESVHLDPVWAPRPFAPPRPLFESDHIRVEWQIMDNRQPFYHRNADVDELSYQVAGDRTLMTELGSLEHRPGDFSRIPRGVAHDNLGRRDIHLLFYVPAPVEELVPPVASSELRLPPFPGWEAATVNELITECLGGPEHDVAIAPADERLLLEQAERESERLHLLRVDDGAPGTVWLYRGSHVLIGQTRVAPAAAREYRRHLDADEIQYQISGRRTLVTQRGTLHLDPGDAVRIPVGVAFTSIATEEATHLTLASALAVPQIAAGTAKAERLDVAALDAVVDQ